MAADNSQPPEDDVEWATWSIAKHQDGARVAKANAAKRASQGEPGMAKTCLELAQAHLVLVGLYEDARATFVACRAEDKQ